MGDGTVFGVDVDYCSGVCESTAHYFTLSPLVCASLELMTAQISSSLGPKLED